MPRKPTSHLFELIASLSRSEKRYFTLRAKMQNVAPEYLTLFHAIEKLDEYDETVLLTRLKKSGQHKNLAFRKAHLYEILLHALQDFHREDKAANRILSMLNNVQNTYEKGLYSQTEYWIERGLETARKNDQLNHQLLFIQWKRDLINHLQSTKLKQDMSVESASAAVKSLDLDQHHLMEVLNTDYESSRIYTRSMLIIRFGKFDELEGTKSEIEGFINSYALHQLPFSTHMKIRRAEGMVLFALRDLESQIRSLTETIKLWESHPEMIEEFAQEYALNLNNILVAKIESGKTDGCEHYLNKLATFMDDNAKNRSQVERIRAYAFHQYNVMKLFNTKGEYQRAIDAFNKRRFDRSGLDLNTYKRSQIILELCVSHLFLREFRPLARLALEAMTEFENYQEEVLSQIRVMFCIAHYHKGNLEILEQRIKSTDRLVKQWFDRFPQEFKILQLLSGALKKKTLQSDLIATCNSYPVKVNPHFVYYLRRWSEKMISGESFK